MVPRASPRRAAGADLIAVALLAALAAAVLAEALFGGRVLLPAGLLRHMLPWSKAIVSSEPPPPWNPLMWDGIAQFYPWRHYAAEWVARGRFPLWNPYQFCGTPFFANSQSALFYPVNALFYLPGPLSTAQRFAWVAWVHLTLAGSGMYAWLRALGCRSPAALLAGAAFMLSGFAVTWLELPTFLSVACWIPLLLLMIHETLRRRSLAWAAAAGGALGMMLLGGHLQIAFYGLLAGVTYALFEVGRTTRDERRGDGETGRRGDGETWETGRRGETIGPSLPVSPSPRLPVSPSFVAGAALLAAGIGFALAAPQVLPAVELSRLSHRAGSPNWEGYRAYVGYAVPWYHLVTLYLPDFFGNPKRGDYWGAANYAEYAGYSGVVTLLLALVGIVAGWRRNRVALYLTALALLSLWMAAGSPLNALFYFGIPGFGQSGSPGRILVLFCLSIAALAGLGLDWLLATAEDAEASPRWLWGALGGALVLWFLGLAAASTLTAAFVRAWGLRSFASVWGASLPALQLALVLLLVTSCALAGGIAGLRTGRLSRDLATALIAVVPCLAVAADLYFFAAGFLLTAPPSMVYPATSLTRQITPLPQGSTPVGRILPLNRRWSLVRSPQAILPPNAAMVYGFADVQGYDSLYLRRYKALVNTIQGGDTSPPENGNMVFLSNLDSPLFPLLGVSHAVSAEGVSAVGTANMPFGGTGPGRYRWSVPRAFVVYRWETASAADALAAVVRLATSREFQPGQAFRDHVILNERLLAAAVLETDLPPPRQSRRSMFPLPSAILAGETPDQVSIAVQSAWPGMLLVTDNDYPGWVATVTAQGGAPHPAPVLRADSTFRAIPIPQGASVVTLRFEPASLRLGLFLAAVALAVLSGIFAREWTLGGAGRACLEP